MHAQKPHLNCSGAFIVSQTAKNHPFLIINYYYYIGSTAKAGFSNPIKWRILDSSSGNYFLPTFIKTPNGCVEEMCQKHKRKYKNNKNIIIIINHYLFIYLFIHIYLFIYLFISNY